MNLKDLIARLKTLKAEATAILDEADKNNGGDPVPYTHLKRPTSEQG